jgi:hypothetical protein
MEIRNDSRLETLDSRSAVCTLNLYRVHSKISNLKFMNIKLIKNNNKIVNFSQILLTVRISSNNQIFSNFSEKFVFFKKFVNSFIVKISLKFKKIFLCNFNMMCCIQ